MGQPEAKTNEDQQPGAEDEKKPTDEKVETQTDDDSEDTEIVGVDEKTRKYIKDLRDENKRYRLKSKEADAKVNQLSERFSKLEGGLKKLTGGDEKETSPEEKLQALEVRNNVNEFRAAVLETAVAEGINADGLEYFEFLIAKKAGKLEEGEEITPEELSEIALIVKKSMSNGSKGNSTSIHGAGGDQQVPPPGSKNELTPERFAKMGILEQTDLYRKSPDVYAKMRNEARDKKLL